MCILWRKPIRISVTVLCHTLLNKKPGIRRNDSRWMIKAVDSIKWQQYPLKPSTNRQMNTKAVIKYITDWMNSYISQSGSSGFVVGVSGGIDSAVTSSLAASTGKPVLCLEMPIYQADSQVSRAREHIRRLKSGYENVSSTVVDLSSTFDTFIASLPPVDDENLPFLALANSRARLRMTALYYFAGIHGYLVAGTGNKVEDFGVGFFTKYGDGGVDLSPIADLMKSEVYAVARTMGVSRDIQIAAPTDGLWGDDRTDEDQIGASYPELEWAMEFDARDGLGENDEVNLDPGRKKVLAIYRKLHRANQHKMEPVPVCHIPQNIRNG